MLVLSRRRLAQLFFILIIIISTLGIFHTSLKNTAEEVVNALVPSIKLHPIYAVDTQDKKIAISFDATWGSTRTPQILGILAKHNLKTTFFLTNIWLKQYPELAKEIATAGHEIGLHSANHPKLTDLNDEKIKQELLDNAKLISEVTGQKPFLFRPPFGAYNNRVITIARELNLIPIQWSVDSLDWQNFTEDQIVERVMKKIHPGAIVLFHNDGTNTPQALEPIIQYLHKQGYSIIPISELIYKDNFYIDVNGVQKIKN